MGHGIYKIHRYNVRNKGRVNQHASHDYIQNNFSDPGSHFQEFAENATYTPEINTVTIEVGDIDDLLTIAYFDYCDLNDLLEMLNSNYNVINGINFSWVE